MIQSEAGGTAARLALLPAISRARGYRLYTAAGTRLLDLWQYGGRAVLGHKPEGMIRELKNAAERGLFAPFPSPYAGRFIRALSALFPGKHFRVYPGEAALREDLAGAGFPRVPFPDSALPRHRNGPGILPVYWRPFADVPPGAVFVPVLPFPFTPSPAVLALAPEEAARFFPGMGDAPGVYPLGTPAPVVLAPAIRAVYSLIASPARKITAFPKIRRVLEHQTTAVWRRRGIYLSRTVAADEDAWTALFRRFLAAGFLMPPERNAPLILPGVLSPGEEAGLAGFLADTDGDGAGKPAHTP
ncbi:MAG: hypothetical protein LBC88_06145 [Spirochaetaceae bacterium]|nr:hypothetical protein [Spirochaetaceae bacterium]